MFIFSKSVWVIILFLEKKCLSYLYHEQIILLFICNCGRNIYRMPTNKIFSPMTRALTDCILDPILIIFHYISNKEKDDFLYFIINLIVTVIMVLSSFIYNELLIVYCCDLEYNTHEEVSIRALKSLSSDYLNESSEIDDDD